MNILHIWDGDYPWDVRVEKINDALVEAHHDIFLVCRNIARKKLIESHRGVLIHRLPTVSPKYGTLNNIVSFPAFFNPLWKYYTLKVARQNKIDLIIVRDLPLALLALWVGRRISAPVIMDMAENYPCMLESILQCGGFRFSNFITRNPRLAVLVEKIVFKHMDKIVVVIEEARDRLLSLGVPPETIEIVRNTPPKSMACNLSHIPLPDEPFFNEKDRLVLLYNGLTNPPRGILDFVKMVPQIIKRIPDIKLIINGKGHDDHRINSIINKYQLHKSVFHKGWVSHQDKLRYLAHCDVGIIPYHITSHWNTTIPNKLFDYMSMKKPVLSTRVIPTARIIKECNCGLLYTKNDINDLCNKLEILRNIQTRAKLGTNGFKKILSKYNWESDKQAFLYAVTQVTRHKTMF